MRLEKLFTAFHLQEAFKIEFFEVQNRIKKVTLDDPIRGAYVDSVKSFSSIVQLLELWCYRFCRQECNQIKRYTSKFFVFFSIYAVASDWFKIEPLKVVEAFCGDLLIQKFDIKDSSFYPYPEREIQPLDKPIKGAYSKLDSVNFSNEIYLNFPQFSPAGWKESLVK